MTEARDIARQVAGVQDLLTAKFGIRRAALPKMLKRAGRRLPRGMRARVQILIDAEGRAGHPKLARQMDVSAVMRAAGEVTTYLEAIDVSARRKGVALGLAGIVVFNLLVVIGAFITFLWWRDYI